MVACGDILSEEKEYLVHKLIKIKMGIIIG
jgi:hypothetical protein